MKYTICYHVAVYDDKPSMIWRLKGKLQPGVLCGGAFCFESLEEAIQELVEKAKEFKPGKVMFVAEKPFVQKSIYFESELEKQTWKKLGEQGLPRYGLKHRKTLTAMVEKYLKQEKK